MKIKPNLNYELFEIITPKIVENPSFKRTKERCWTLNLEETVTVEDTVIVFPCIKIEEDFQS